MFKKAEAITLIPLARLLLTLLSFSSTFTLFGSQDQDLRSSIKLDNKPIDNPSATQLSYASAVQSSLPCVLTVLVTKHVELQQDDKRKTPSHLDLSRSTTTKLKNFVAMRSHGSGVILTSNGYILTNHHVVDQADTIEVRLSRQAANLSATLIASDPQTDLALLKVESSGLKPITVANSDHLLAGDIVLALGSPFGLEQSVTLGIVSATGRSLQNANTGLQDHIQTDASINPGNSGGALVDGLGRLIGINVATYRDHPFMQTGIGFAIPANLAMRVASDLLQHGRLLSGYLGAEHVECSPEEAMKITSRDDLRPAKITSIELDSPADLAGLRAGDIITEVQDQPVLSRERFAFQVAVSKPGSALRLTVIRGESQEKISLQLGSKAVPIPNVSSSSDDRSKGVLVSDNPRLILREPSRQDFLRLDIPSHIKGFLVVSAELNGAPLPNLKPDDLLLSVNQKPAEDLGKIKSQMSKQPRTAPLYLKLWRQSKEVSALIPRSK